ncbi:MAG: YkvA family protein [Deltaproteobacteria bacterium]
MSTNEKSQATNMAKEALMLIPNFVKLMYRLVQDEKVSKTDKALLLGTIIYVASPLDFLPDFIPFLGKVDDILLIALVLKRLMDGVGRDLMLQYWDGNEDLLILLEKIVDFSMLLVPQGIYDKLVKKSEKDYTDVEFQVNEE